MRSFSFKAKNIGRERYLTYIMGEECELDEDVLDYCEENKLKELIDVIYEEDDDYDYLTYDITGKMSLEKCIEGAMDKEKVFKILRNIALGMVSCKEQAIHLSYILLNKKFVYVDPDTLNIKFICIPVESEGSIATEFKGFIRQLLANMKYNVEEDLSYVGQLLTYINGDSFNLRGLIGLSEALMEDAGIDYEEEEAIATDDGAEVINIQDEEEDAPVENPTINNFMDDLGDPEEKLPEIGDDEDDEDDEIDAEDEADSDTEAETEAGDVKEAEINAEAETKVEDKIVEEAKAEDEIVEEAAEVEDEIEENVAEETEKEENSDINETAADEIDEEASKEEEALKEEEDTSEDIAETEQADIDNTVEAVKEESKPNKEKPKIESMEEIKARLERIVNGENSGRNINSLEDLDEIIGSRPVVKKNTIKVSRAAIIQNAVEQEEEGKNEKAIEEISKESKKEADKKDVVIEEIDDSMNAGASVAEKPKQEDESVRSTKGNSILSKRTASVNNTMLGFTGSLKICPYLIRVNTEERVMITKAVFKVGKASRGVDYTVDGNGAISRQHAVILQKDGVYYIKDNKSTNHTYVNDKKVEDGKEEILTHDCKVRLGDEEFVFKIR